MFPGRGAFWHTACHSMVKPGQVTLSQQEIGWTPSANATAGVQIAAVQ